ncbi:hypothetical protein [Pigmentibacter ruber]|uniref:hypothetical protein n=1 Tax=Pigmentibacter ruber TaxID=2683196 RepID=UPI00131A963A|nr:hypothetical protein [Pigmentibacter ruber]
MKNNTVNKKSHSATIANHIRYKIWEVESEKNKNPTFYFFNISDLKTCVVSIKDINIVEKKFHKYKFIDESKIQVSFLNYKTLINIDMYPNLSIEFLDSKQKYYLNEIKDKNYSSEIEKKCGFNA